MTQIVGVENSAYKTIMGQIWVVPVFGESFARFFPMLLMFFAVLKCCDIYGKCLYFFGLNEEADYHEKNDAVNFDLGRSLVMQEIQRQAQELSTRGS